MEIKLKDESIRELSFLQAELEKHKDGDSFSLKLYNIVVQLNETESNEEFSELLDKYNEEIITGFSLLDDTEIVLRLKNIKKKHNDYKYALEHKSNNQMFADINIDSNLNTLVPELVKKYLPNYGPRLSKEEGVIHEIDFKRKGNETFDELVNSFLEVVIHNELVNYLKINPWFINAHPEIREEFWDSKIPEFREKARMIVQQEKEKPVSDRYVEFFKLKTEEQIRSFFKTNGFKDNEIAPLVEHHQELGFEYKRLDLEENYDDFVSRFNDFKKIKKKDLVAHFFKSRKHIVSHFFYNEKEWHCFYWSPRDLMGDHSKTWGSHYHYMSSYVSNFSRDEFEDMLRNFDYSNDIHVKKEG